MNKVAIVDDVATNGMILKGYLVGLPDVTCQIYTSPLAALEACLVETPDLVLLDYLMPEMDGIEFLRRFRVTASLRDVPVVMVSGDESRTTLYEALKAGATDFLRKPVDRSELLARARNMLELRSRQRALVEANAKLVMLTTTDPLTGLKNRRAFLDEVAHELLRTQRFNRPFSLAILDVDHFKSVNDAHGHGAGDAVLKALGQLLTEEMRGIDRAGRLGGEQFGLLFAEVPLAAGMAACTRLLQRLRETAISIAGGDLIVTASIGLVEGGPQDRSVEAILKRAEVALHAAKAGGRDRLETALCVGGEKAA